MNNQLSVYSRFSSKLCLFCCALWMLFLTACEKEKESTHPFQLDQSITWEDVSPQSAYGGFNSFFINAANQLMLAAPARNAEIEGSILIQINGSWEIFPGYADDVLCINEYQGEIYVGGNLESNQSFFKYTAEGWQSVMPPDGWGQALEVHQGELFFGFSELGKTDGNTYTTVNSEWPISHLQSFWGSLYAISVNKLLKLENSKWIEITAAPYLHFTSLDIVDDRLIAGSKCSGDGEGSTYCRNTYLLYEVVDDQVIGFGPKLSINEDYIHNVKKVIPFQSATYALLDLNVYKGQNGDQLFVDYYSVVVKAQDDDWVQVGSSFDFTYDMIAHNDQIYVGGDKLFLLKQ